MRYTHIIFDACGILTDSLVNPVYEGIDAVLPLLAGSCKLGLFALSGRDLPPGLSGYFTVLRRSDDNSCYKVGPELFRQYRELTGAASKDILYIGVKDSDIQCAKAADIDRALALWGCKTRKHIRASYYLEEPSDIVTLLNSERAIYEKRNWLSWAMELEFIAQAGITYSKDSFDIERFHRIREISAELMSMKTGFGKEYITEIFCNETGFQTPKLDTRAAIFHDDKILLVQEKNGTWALPGGWVDVNQSIATNTVKEVKEEAGLDVIPVKLIAVQDRNLHNPPVYAYGICKAFVQCKVLGGDFIQNMETISSAYFSLNQLPALAEEKNTARQIALCFEAYHCADWVTQFD